MSSSMYHAAVENLYCASQALFNVAMKHAVQTGKDKNVEAGNSPSKLIVFADGT